MNTNDLKVLTRNLDVQLLRAFVAVAQSESMTAAAGLLNVTQGAVSQQIKRLEELLQKQLFTRAGQGLSTTVDGERLLLHAGKLIALNDEIFGLMTTPEFSGAVRLGIPYDIITPFAAPILKSFGHAYPKVRVELELSSSRELKNGLAKGELDLVLTTENQNPKGSELLLKNDLVWVGGQNAECHHKTPLPIVLCNEDCMFRPVMLEALKRKGVDWQITSATRNMDATYAMLQADLGVTAVLESTVPAFINILGEEDGLPALPEFFINLYTPPGGGNALTKELANHIRDQFSGWRRSQIIAS